MTQKVVKVRRGAVVFHLKSTPMSEIDSVMQKARRRMNKRIESERIVSLLAALARRGVEISDFAREFLFYGPKTSHPWRFDLAHQRKRVAIEIDGGNFAGKRCVVCGQRSGGRHNRGDGDRVKKNTAAAYGWRLLAFSSTDIDRKVDQCAALIVQALTYGQR